MKIWINRSLTMALFWCVCGLGASGLVMKYRLGGEYPYLPSETILGLSWSDWALLHLCLALSMLGLTTFHLFMNRKWIYTIVSNRRAWLFVSGLSVGALLIIVPLVIPSG